MKYALIVVIALIVGCGPRDTKFHYKDNVIVTNGFFTGQTGEVIDYEFQQYLVKFDSGDIEYLLEQDLKLQQMVEKYDENRN